LRTRTFRPNNDCSLSEMQLNSALILNTVAAADTSTMYKGFAFVFWTTLSLYLVTLFTVPYVGVYLTYVAVPVIVLSGLVMKFSKPRSEQPGAFENAAKAVSDGLYVFATTVEKLASDAEKATAELRAKVEAEHAAKAEAQAKAFSDASSSLRRNKLAKLRLSQSLQSGSITREAFDTEIARIDSEIAAIEKTQQLTTFRS